MPTYRKARQFATDFENVYPKTLPERLAWWHQVLGIDRLRFLRMMGMSTDEANRQKNNSWETVLEKKEWEENGWWVEGKLHELLSLFDYDWQALAARLHQTVRANGEELARIPRPRGNIAKRQYVPSDDGSDILLNQLAKGGPQSFSALLAYLSSESLAGEHST